ncbi:MAG: hypothetical protein K2Z81_06715, partial [Cyanobacteria bacterium]|nr:hypothetical protein [Cyanobacteriota bacterium]
MDTQKNNKIPSETPIADNEPNIRPETMSVLKRVVFDTISPMHVALPMNLPSSIYRDESARSITAGRERIKRIKEDLEKKGYEVIYGDT